MPGGDILLTTPFSFFPTLDMHRSSGEVDATEEDKVKSRAFFMLALSVSFAAGLSLGDSKRKPSLQMVDVVQTTDAAFRDGLYQARLDAEQGRKPRPAIGRWGTAEARASFFAGYRSGYRPSSEMVWGRMAGPSVAETAAAGYRDGMIDGGRHRIASQPFRAEQTANYLAAGAVYFGTSVAPDEFKNYYREGYRDGYQHAYFVQPDRQGEKATQ